MVLTLSEGESCCAQAIAKDVVLKSKEPFPLDERTLLYVWELEGVSRANLRLPRGEGKRTTTDACMDR